MNKYRITMKGGTIHEVGANGEVLAMIEVWRNYYGNWSFQEFVKGVVKKERIDEK